MEPLWKLSFLLEPATIAVLVTAVLVTFASAFRALNYSKEIENNPILVNLNKFHALMIPVACSFTLMILFYFFSTVEQLLAIFMSITSAMSLYLCFIPYLYKLRLQSMIVVRCVVLAVCFGVVVTWLVSGNWILYNLLGISNVFLLVTHLRLPNFKICVVLLMCLFVYDIFWVFYSERFFGANVMESVAIKQAVNPIYTVANRLNLPGLQWIKKDMELPGKLIFPQNLFGGLPEKESHYAMLGLGDMALPAVLLALILCFDYRKSQDKVSLLDLVSSKDHKYIWYAISGYAIGLVASMATSFLTRSGQPALLYLVPSILGPVILVSWMRRELEELWGGSWSNSNGKTHAS